MAKIKKIMRQVTGTAKGFTLTKEDLKILDKDVGDIVSIGDDNE